MGVQIYTQCQFAHPSSACKFASASASMSIFMAVALSAEPNPLRVWSMRDWSDHDEPAHTLIIMKLYNCMPGVA